MTIDQFLAKLARTSRRWAVLENGHIRHRNGSCPVCALTDDLEVEWVEAAERIGLRMTTARRIALAADARKHPRVKELRRRILRACGLPPEQG